MTCRYIAIPKEDTYALIKRAQKGDEDAKQLLAQQNTGLVKNLALKFSSSEYELEDLIQIGYVGLLRAIEKFDPEFDVMFSTYAVPMIMGEIKRFFRDNGKIKMSRSLKSEIQALKQVEDGFAAKKGRLPRISEIAESMGVTAEHVLEIMEAKESLHNVCSLDNQVVEQEVEQYYKTGSPESGLEQLMIREEINRLKQKEKQVIVLRYYRDMTQQEIAERMKISQVQVSRIEKKALEKMRKKMAE